MDFGLKGLKEGFLKALKVLLWIAVSGAITAIIGYVAQFQNDTTYGVVYLIVNPVLMWLKTWVETKTPKNYKLW